MFACSHICRRLRRAVLGVETEAPEGAEFFRTNPIAPRSAPQIAPRPAVKTLTIKLKDRKHHAQGPKRKGRQVEDARYEYQKEDGCLDNSIRIARTVREANVQSLRESEAVQLRDRIQEGRGVSSALESLASVHVSVPVLKASGIALVVKALRNSADSSVATAASSLIAQWKAQVKADNQDASEKMARGEHNRQAGTQHNSEAGELEESSTRGGHVSVEHIAVPTHRRACAEDIASGPSDQDPLARPQRSETQRRDAFLETAEMRNHKREAGGGQEAAKRARYQERDIEAVHSVRQGRDAALVGTRAGDKGEQSWQGQGCEGIGSSNGSRFRMGAAGADQGRMLPGQDSDRRRWERDTGSGRERERDRGRERAKERHKAGNGDRGLDERDMQWRRAERRARAEQVLRTALAPVQCQVERQDVDARRLQVCREMEAEVYRLMQDDDDGYVRKIKTLKFNLAANQELAARLLEGRVQVEEVAGMSSEALASKQTRQRRQHNLAHAAFEDCMYLTAREGGARSKDFVCPACGQRDVLFRHEHLLPDNFWSYNDTAYQVLIACNVCAHEWRE